MKIGSCLNRMNHKLFLLVLALLGATPLCAQAQTAVIEDAWWTFQQDCDGDGLYAGTLAGNGARLNWNPDVLNCNGTITVTEIVYAKPSSGSIWTPIYTNASHSITGCRSSDAQHVDLTFSSSAAMNDFKIEIYRTGQLLPDFVRSDANDTDLDNHGEESLLSDFCLSDNFSTSAALSGGMGNKSDHNGTATKQVGEPNHAGNAGGKSLWYSWTANGTTPVTFETTGSGFDTLLAVYTGNALNTLSLVAANDDINGSTNRQSRVTFTPVSGTTYRIAVDGFAGSAGLLTLSWVQSGNNLPDLIFWSPAVSPSIINRTFTTEECEVLEGCAVPGTRKLLSFTSETRNIGTGDLIMGNPATNSLFHFASCHGHYHFEGFAVYDLLDANGNSVASGNKIGFCLLDDRPWSTTANPTPKYDCNNQGIQAGWSDVYAAGLPCQFIDITSVPAGEYVLRMEVNPYGALAESDTNNNVILVSVSIPVANCIDIPPNDSFSNPVVISDTPFSFSQFNQCATKESGEPNHAGSTGGHSLWYSWTPTHTHNALITTKRSDYNTTLAVYTGNSVGSLTLIGSDDDITGEYNPQSEVFFTAVAGTTYRIAVDGFGTAVGTTVLNVNPPGNDDFDEPFLLIGTAGSTNGTTVGASKHLYEPAHASDVGGHSVWYTWTAPTNGPVEFNTQGSTFNTSLAIYTGNHLVNGLEVVSNNDEPGGALTSSVTFQAEAGTTYQIAVDGFGGDIGNLTLNWNMDSTLTITPQPGNTFAISYTGVIWQRYLLLSTSDFTTWTTNGPVTMLNAPQTFTNAPVQPLEFYQSRRVP